jgi:hypothetical protein
MATKLREHAGAGLVAVAIFIAALLEGAFDPTAYAAASIVIWAAAAAGLASRALPSAPIALNGAVAGSLLAALMLMAAASLGWVGDQGRAFEEAVRASAYLGLFVIAACTAGSAGRARWLTGLSLGLGAVAVVSLLSHLQPGLLDDDELGALIPGAADRLSYPIGYWNGLAGLLALGAVLIARFATAAPGRVQRSGATAMLPLVLLALWLTESRGGAVAVVVGLAALVLLSTDRQGLAGRAALAGLGAAVLIVVGERLDGLDEGMNSASRHSDGDVMTAVALATATLTGASAWMLEGRIPRLPAAGRAAVAVAAVAATALIGVTAAADPAERFRNFKAPPEDVMTQGTADTGDELNSSGRWQFWGEALDAFGDEPLLGVGAGGFEDYWAEHASVLVFVRNPHSLPLQLAAELGIAGMALLLGFGTALGLAAVRWIGAERRRGDESFGGDGAVLVAVLLTAGVGALIDWTWLIPAVIAPAVIGAGLLTAAAPGRRLRANGYWLGLATVGVAWVSILAAGLVVLTEIKLEQSRDAAAAGRIEDGIERAEEARTVQPWSSEPYTQLALLEEERGDTGHALEFLSEAQERDSLDWRLPLIEVRLHEERDDLSSARLALDRALELSPLAALQLLRGAE